MTGWQGIRIVYGTLLVVMCLSVLAHFLTAQQAPMPALDGDVQPQLFHVGPFQIIASFGNFGLLVATVAILITYFLGNRRAATRWLVIAVACFVVTLAALVLISPGESGVG
jgi:hypothetical protein